MRLRYISPVVAIALVLVSCGGNESENKAGANAAQAEKLPAVEVMKVNTQTVPQIGEYAAARLWQARK